MNPDFVQLLAPLGGAAVAFIGVVATNYATGRRERKNRSNAHLSRLIDKRYELYLEYIDILDANADALMGDEMLAERDVTVSDLQSLERRMRVYASNDVLTAFEFYRDAMRTIATEFKEMDSEQQARLRYEVEVSSTLALAMVRADLEVDAYDTWRKRWARKRVVKRVMRGEDENLRLLAHSLYEEHQRDGGGASDDSGARG